MLEAAWRSSHLSVEDTATQRHDFCQEFVIPLLSPVAFNPDIRLRTSVRI
ncbi:hypothetical protein KPSA1_03419 [Pseudomonas syringae pv. actinidiae]|uniref:Uncharacterized protein n=1 Tax=Pseudomonas syringae pv. actinidiae TaxID=103796 RepID=A0A2V0QA93_PSESF|nr:hypothetical protein KPSA1_03419 [Pseudomonas syringae pv. actinidiae]